MSSEERQQLVAACFVLRSPRSAADGPPLSSFTQTSLENATSTLYMGQG